MAAASRWMFEGKLPGTRLAKLNGRHTDILDALATCKCSHSQDRHDGGKCPCGCVQFEKVSRMTFVLYDFRHTFATRAAEAGMPVATLARILGHGDLRSISKYVHVRQEAQDRAMDAFDEAQNISDGKRSSGFRPVDAAEKQDFAGSSGILREGVNDRKIN
jgi:hypothetical protein